MSQVEKITHQIQTAISTLTDDQVEHFFLVTNNLLQCYNSPSKSGVMIVRDLYGEEINVVGINANQLQAGEIIKEISSVINPEAVNGNKLPMSLN